MRFLRFTVALSILCACAGVAATAPAKSAAKKGTTKPAATKKATSKKAAATSKTVSTKSTAASTKTKSAKGQSTKGKTTKKAAPAATWRTRQQAPTPDRYKEIQQALIAKGYLKGEPTGVWDSDSIDAISRFQVDQKLTPTGKINAPSLIGLGLGAKSAGAPEAPPLPGAPAPVQPAAPTAQPAADPIPPSGPAR